MREQHVEDDNTASVLDNVKKLCGFRLDNVLDSESVAEDDIEK